MPHRIYALPFSEIVDVPRRQRVDADSVEGEHVAAAEIEDDVAPRLMREGAERMSVEQRRVEHQPIARGVKVGDRILVEADGENEAVAATPTGELVSPRTARDAVRAEA